MKGTIARELARLDARRNAMQFVPMTAAGVEAARQAVSTAERNRISECGANNEKRGRLCETRKTRNKPSVMLWQPR